jgi:glycosyltransferase involved in cell wall biosynthesis
MHILHLAYEDPAQPGAGGGSVRTREINRRLSARHTITALTSGYLGAVPRVEDGINWVPIGTRGAGKLDRLSYFALLAPAVARAHFDLLVEDFGAPFSVALSPLFTRQPVVASVQWLFAREMRQKYRLPFDVVEGAGLRFYHRFIAVSGWLADEIRRRRAGAEVVTIANGADPLAYKAAPAAPRHLIFVGRLDLAQKGGDLLLESAALMRGLLGSRMPSLLIVGDGPDQAQMEQLAYKLDLTDIVSFCGRITGAEKYRLMAEAHAVLMPSRFETFGMVAVEAQAAGAPVVAYDVGPLAEVAGGGEASLIRPFDVAAFAEAAAALVADPEQADRCRAAGRSWARRYNWDELAVRQEQFYLETIARHVAVVT